MGVCETVSTITASIEDQLSAVQPNHINMIAVMKAMPVYLEKGDLASWEEAYRSAIGVQEDEGSMTYKALDLIYELAGANLFGAFQKHETLRIYEFVTSELTKMGLVIPTNLDVSEW